MVKVPESSDSPVRAWLDGQANNGWVILPGGIFVYTGGIVVLDGPPWQSRSDRLNELGGLPAPLEAAR